MFGKVWRAVVLWLLDRTQNLLRALSGQPPVGENRIQPLPAVPLTFREGWWGDLEGTDEVALGRRWLNHPLGDVALLFEPLPQAPSLDLVLRAAPPPFVARSDPRLTAHGVTVIEGSAMGLPAWLLWHPVGTLLVFAHFEGATLPRVAVRFIASAKPA